VIFIHQSNISEAHGSYSTEALRFEPSAFSWQNKEWDYLSLLSWNL